MRGKAELPAGLKLPGELRLKLRRPTAKDAAAAEGRRSEPSEVGGPEVGASRRPRTAYRSEDRPAFRAGPNVPEYEGPPEDDSWIIGIDG